MSDELEIVHERDNWGFGSGLRVVRLEEFEEPYGMTGDERLAYRRRFVTLFVDGTATRRGGLGRVSRAVNAMGEVFALKTLLVPERAENEAEDAFAARSERARKAFRKEYEVQRSLSGFKGFPRLYGFAQVDGVPAIVMEWVDGITLAQVRRELSVDEAGRVAPLDAARLGRDLFGLLTRLDLVGEGFVHRDISPSNIMLRTAHLSAAEQAAEGAFDLCLIDFGSTVSLDPEQDPRLTGTYATVSRATVAYAPPEMLTDDIPRVAQMRKSSSVDVYAAASVLFELVGGALPFDVEEGGEVSPYRVKMDEKPAALVTAHAPGADMAALLPCEPDAAVAIAHVMQELGTDLDPADACRALAHVDEQLADLLRVCLQAEQGKRPTAQAMCESLTAFCLNYGENIARSVRGDCLLPCTAGSSWMASMSPYAVNRVVHTVGRAVAWGLLLCVTGSTAVLLDGMKATLDVGPLHWSGELFAPVVALALLAPAVCGYVARAFARRRGQGGAMQGSVALWACSLVLLPAFAGLSVRGMSETYGVVFALLATASAGWLPLVLDYAMVVVPALMMELRRMSSFGSSDASGAAPDPTSLEGASVQTGVFLEPAETACDTEESPDVVDTVQ
ncbi:MAG: AarF/UbiB family protein [Coriobacteriaceae bacterium]|nr:AarF/UbiB family protein [Coriobacteriaceae bacterium]